MVGIEGGIADNVVPDRCVARLNYRYAPGRSREQAEAYLRELVGEAEIEILGNSAPAHVVVDRPLVTRLREAGGFAVEPKQAWTPVAQFADAVKTIGKFWAVLNERPLTRAKSASAG